LLTGAIQRRLARRRWERKELSRRSVCVLLIQDDLPLDDVEMIESTIVSPRSICRDTRKGAHVMKHRDGGSGYGLARHFFTNCHRCGDEPPLLHRRIVVERYDDEDKMICERCFIDEAG